MSWVALFHTTVVLVHCNIVNNDYQQDSRVLYTFVPNKPFGSLLEISPTNHVFLKTFNSEYEDKSNNQSKATIIFNELINKRKELMSELYDSVDYNNLKFEYVGPTNDVSFYEYKDSKELFNMIKNSQIKFSEAKLVTLSMMKLKYGSLIKIVIY